LKVDPSVPEPNSDDKVIQISRYDDVGYIIGIVEEKEPKSYKKVVNRPNGLLWKKAIVKELDSLILARSWKLEDKVIGEKQVGNKWVFKKKNY
jgi:hypothetical protein